MKFVGLGGEKGVKRLGAGLAECTDFSSKRLQTGADAVQIALFEQIHRLERLLDRYPLLFGELHERIDVLHTGEVTDRFLDLLYRSRLKTIRRPDNQAWFI